MGYDAARGRGAAVHISSKGLHALLSNDGQDGTLCTPIHSSLHAGEPMNAMLVSSVAAAVTEFWQPCNHAAG